MLVDSFQKQSQGLAGSTETGNDVTGIEESRKNLGEHPPTLSYARPSPGGRAWRRLRNNEEQSTGAEGRARGTGGNTSPR